MILEDIQTFFEESFDTIKKIRRHEINIDNVDASEIERFENLAINYLTFGQHFLRFIEIITIDQVQIFASSEVLDKFCIFINYLIKELAGQNTLALKIKIQKN